MNLRKNPEKMGFEIEFEVGGFFPQPQPQFL
jgi:hypothetical protein